MFEKYNKGITTIKEGIVLENLPFKPLKEFIGKDVKVDGFFFTNGTYGKQVVVVGDGAKINMPARAVEQFEEIANRPEEVDAILEGHCLMTNIKFIKTKNGQTTGYSLADC